MIILGIDPALGNLGWGIISSQNSKLKYINSGSIKTSSGTEIHIRLAQISAELEKIISEYAPDLVSMEETFLNMNAVSSMKLCYARGAVMSLVGKLSLEFREYKPNMIKKAVVGTGHAQKEQVMHMIKVLMPSAFHISSFDETDALATAYAASVYNTLPHLKKK